MFHVMKPLTVAALGLALAMPTADTASAQRRGNVGAAIVGGVIVGAIIAGAASSARASNGYYYHAGGGRCREYADNARFNERRGSFGRAEYWWDRYNAAGC